MSVQMDTILIQIHPDNAYHAQLDVLTAKMTLVFATLVILMDISQLMEDSNVNV